MSEIYHSVTLDEDKCVGCTHCISRCPTEAIRVRGGKARILSERCIDCGVCIRVCPHHAKRAVYDDLSHLLEFEYTIALPAPTLYGQFARLTDIDYVLTGLLELGFDAVFEVSRGAEIVSEATRMMLKNRGEIHGPVISSACPAVVRLIQVSFPSMCENVLPIQAPMHVAARMAKEEAAENTGLPVEKIGVFFISPCPAKVTDAKRPIGMEKSWVDGVLSMGEIYPLLLEKMNKITWPKPLAQSGLIGVSWANNGGEASSLLCENYLAADGMENIVPVLEELDNGKFKSLDFVELNACPGGCVGGVLAVENAYIAKTRIQRLRKYLPVSLNHVNPANLDGMRWQKELEYSGVMEYSQDIAEAMEIMEKIDDLVQSLPGLDCGSCGAPSCHALAEDIVMRGARKNDCIFILREQARTAGVSVSSAPGPLLKRKVW